MAILALDTTTRTGSVAVWREGTLTVGEGDAERTHGERLPGDLLDVLRRAGAELADVETFAVCSGPGSFTGLRVGLATIQGLAMGSGRAVVAVPTLEAIARAHLLERRAGGAGVIVPWMNAQRHEIFAAVFGVDEAGELSLRLDAQVGPAERLAEVIAPYLNGSQTVIVGDGVQTSERALESIRGSGAKIRPEMPTLAPALCLRARDAGPGAHLLPHAIRPVYVRRSDAELARERRRAGGSTT